MSIVRLSAPPDYDYSTIDIKDRARLQADIHKTDYNFVFRGVLAGHRGAQNAILGQLFKKLVNELRDPANNIHPYYDDDNERKVIEILERCTFRVAAPTPAPRNVRGGTKKVSNRKSNGKNKRADVPSESPGGERQDCQEATEEISC